jgi:hypothetical protein
MERLLGVAQGAEHLVVRLAHWLHCRGRRILERLMERFPDAVAADSIAHIKSSRPIECSASALVNSPTRVNVM